MTAPALRPAMLTLVVRGPPVPKARARVVDGHSFTPKRTADAESILRWHAKAAGWTPLAGPLSVVLRFYEADRRRRDLDNLCKLVLDALNGIAWVDDSQIRHIEADRAYDPAMPRTEIEVLPMPEAP